MKLRIISVVLVLATLLACFSAGISRLDSSRQKEDKALLEEALHRTAVACYSIEGVYPPDVAYMQQYYGLHYDESRYFVHYDRFASNLMPDITVMDKSL